jgi:pimeloyl-ACP methyl ester carboxylesterase
MTKQTKPSIVFAHGLWADGSCFQKLIPALQADGHEVMCSQHGLDSLKSDVECVTRCFGRVSGPVVLVGHSYGGTLITHAGMDKRVAALVYIAALAPDETETSQSQQQKFPVTEVFSHIEVADGRIWLKLDGIGVSRVICPRRNKRLSGRPRPCLFPTCSTKRSTVSLGGRSRVGTSWPPKIAPFNRNCTASLQSAWVPQSSSYAPVTCRCSPSRMLCWT